MPEPKDTSRKHFIISIVKSVWRIVASVLLALGGFWLWDANDYTDIVIADAGYVIMLAGGGLLIAEILGIWEEL